jgi:hypothetical protein
MKQYEIRTRDLATVRFVYEHWEGDRYALEHFRENSGPDEVLVLSEPETEAEADKARLDWLEAKPTASAVPRMKARHGSVRAWIDHERNAPQPKITVIATAEGGK